QNFSVYLANRFNRTLHHATCAEGASAACGLGFGQAKQNAAGKPQRLHLAAPLHNLSDRLLMDARHRADFLANLRAWTDKHRINQSRRAEPRLSNEAAQRFAPPQAPRPLSWETHSLFAPVDACFT